MVYVELRRKRNNRTQKKRFGPFEQVSYGGFETASLLCDGKRLFAHVPQFMSIASGWTADNEPDTWDEAIITSA